MNHPESQIQIAVAQFLNLALPADSFWTFIPGGTIGGGKEAAKRGAIVKAMGYRAGCPDLYILWNERAHHIEMKAPGGHPSDNQIEAHTAILKAGGVVGVCYSVENVSDLLTAWGVPLRVAVGGRVG